MANIFLQVLDANYMAVQTERTYVNYMPGEIRGAPGCHETPRPSGAPARPIRRLGPAAFAPRSPAGRNDRAADAGLRNRRAAGLG